VRRTRRAAVTTIALFVVVPAVGCSSSSPTSPSATAPTLTALSIAGAPDLMLVGDTAALTCRSRSDGGSAVLLLRHHLA
jgi:hypothetical protein